MAVLRHCDVTYLPDEPLSRDTEIAFIEGRAFVNAAKHEEVVARHVAEVERLREAVRAMEGKGKTYPPLVMAQRIDELDLQVEGLREALKLSRDRLAFIEPRRQDADSVRRADRALDA